MLIRKEHLIPISMAFFFLTVFCRPGSSQDIHFSQFQHAPLYLNPGLTGVFEGDQRFTGIYRNQWASVPVPYQTVAFAYDQKFYHPALGRGYLGGGLLFHYDRAGDARLSWTQLGVNLSYTQAMTDELFLTAGFQALTGQRAFRREELRFDDQFNGDVFDPGLSSAEIFDRNSTGFLDLGMGMNVFYRSEELRHRIRGGVAFLHLNAPRVGFFEESEVRLSSLARAYGAGQVQVHPDLDVMINLMAQFQNPYREILTTAGVRYYLEQAAGRKLSVELDIGYRFGDALLLLAGVYYQDWFAGLSYDVNTSPFRVATGRQGGPELALRYIIRKVKPPDTFKACPIF